MALTAISGYAHIPPGAVPGYDNLNNWPDSTNRPVFTSGNSTLTWIGPLTGGPSTTNDVRQTLVLTPSGSVTSSSNGQVIQGLSATDITIAHNNVTIRRCYVSGSGADDSVNIFQNAGTTGGVVEDCEVNGNTVSTTQGGGNIGGTSNGVDSMTVRRCSLHNHEQGIRYGLTNLIIQDNWFYNPVGNDCDQIECYGGSNNLTISHNTFGINTTSAGWNSCINFTNFLGTIGPTITVTNNRFVQGATFFAICDDNSQGGGSAVIGTFTNNGFYLCPSPRRDGMTITTNTGNYTMATLNATSGTLFGGVGAI